MTIVKPALKHCSFLFCSNHLTSIVYRPCSKKLLLRAGKLKARKIIGNSCTDMILTIWTRCDCHDVTSIYSLNSQKLPNNFSYCLGTKLHKNRSSSSQQRSTWPVHSKIQTWLPSSPQHPAAMDKFYCLCSYVLPWFSVQLASQQSALQPRTNQAAEDTNQQCLLTHSFPADNKERGNDTSSLTGYVTTLSIPWEACCPPPQWGTSCAALGHHWNGQHPQMHQLHPLLNG